MGLSDSLSFCCRLLASYQNHLDQARYDLESSREMYSSGIGLNGIWEWYWFQRYSNLLNRHVNCFRNWKKNILEKAWYTVAANSANISFPEIQSWMTIQSATQVSLGESQAILWVRRRDGWSVNKINSRRTAMYRSASCADPCSTSWPFTRSEVKSPQRLQRPKCNVVVKSEGEDAGSNNNDRSEKTESPKIRRFLDSSWGVSVQLVKSVTENVGALLLVFLVTESANFVANRLFHRLTNTCMFLFAVMRSIWRNIVPTPLDR